VKKLYRSWQCPAILISENSIPFVCEHKCSSLRTSRVATPINGLHYLENGLFEIERQNWLVSVLDVGRKQIWLVERVISVSNMPYSNINRPAYFKITLILYFGNNTKKLDKKVLMAYILHPFNKIFWSKGFIAGPGVFKGKMRFQAKKAFEICRNVTFPAATITNYFWKLRQVNKPVSSKTFSKTVYYHQSFRLSNFIIIDNKLLFLVVPAN